MKTFSDEQIRAYFLGKLATAESEIFEEECAAGEELTQQAQMVERELIDDYVRGNLPETEARLFRENYPQTAARRERISAAQNLWKIAAEQNPAAKPFWQNLFGVPYGFRLAFGGLLFLLILAALAFYLPFFNAGETEFADVKVVDPSEKAENPQIQGAEDQNPKTAAENVVVPKNEAENDLNPLPKNTLPPKTLPGQKSGAKTTPGYAAFLLYPGAVRGEQEQSIAIAREVKKINLLLNPSGESSDYKTYRAVLKTAEGDTVYASPDSKSLSFSIFSNKLENRTYVIFLEGKNTEGEFESIAEYTFRVRR